LVVVMWMGIFPASFLNVFHASVTALIEKNQVARAAAEVLVLAGP